MVKINNEMLEIYKREDINLNNWILIHKITHFDGYWYGYDVLEGDHGEAILVKITKNNFFIYW